MKSIIISISIFLIITFCAKSASSCSIVYGSNWAFVSEVPAHWNSACGDQAIDGTAITLWPKNVTLSSSPSYIYVTVSSKDTEDFDTFILNEIERYKKSAPDAKDMEFDSVQTISPTRKLLHVRNAPGGRDEIVMYIDSPTVYYMIVMTSVTSTMTTKYRSAFDLYAKDFSATAITIKHQPAN